MDNVRTYPDRRQQDFAYFFALHIKAAIAEGPTGWALESCAITVRATGKRQPDSQPQHPKIRKHMSVQSGETEACQVQIESDAF